MGEGVWVGVSGRDVMTSRIEREGVCSVSSMERVMCKLLTSVNFSMVIPLVSWSSILISRSGGQTRPVASIGPEGRLRMVKVR